VANEYRAAWIRWFAPERWRWPPPVEWRRCIDRTERSCCFLRSGLCCLNIRSDDGTRGFDLAAALRFDAVLMALIERVLGTAGTVFFGRTAAVLVGVDDAKARD